MNTQKWQCSFLNLYVQGKSWGGYESEMDYKISEDQAGKITNLAQAKLIAGDFESISFAEIIKDVVTTERFILGKFGDDK